MFESAEFKAKYGTLVKDLNKETFIGMYWSIIIQIRWIVTMGIMIYLRDFYFAQLMTLLFISGTL